MRNLVRSTRGQELAEFALTVPILIMFIVGITDLGRVVHYYSSIYNAAREGARYGVVHPDDVAGIQAAARRLMVGLDPADLTIPAPTRPDAQHIRLCVSYKFTPVTPLVANLIGAEEVNLRSCATMLLEQ